MTVRSGMSMLCCGQRPRLFLALAMSVRMLKPLMNPCPAVGAYMPVRTDIVVVLPAPLCPRRVVTLPR